MKYMLFAISLFFSGFSYANQIPGRAHDTTDQKVDTTHPASSALATKKDSVKPAYNGPAQKRDSLFGRGQPSNMMDLLFNDFQRFYTSKKGINTFRMEGFFKGFQYNTVEGISVNPSVVLSRLYRDKNSQLQWIFDARYGFTNHHINPWAGIVFSQRKEQPGSYHRYYIAGGKRVSQFFKMSSLTGGLNTVSTLLYGRNDMKLYENYFLKTGYKHSWGRETQLTIEGRYEDRLPLQNATDYIFNKKHKSRLTPNYPTEMLTSPFPRHQAVVFHAGVTLRPGRQGVQNSGMPGFPFPILGFDFYKGIPGLAGSNEDFDRWRVNMHDEQKTAHAGRLKYLWSAGGFLDKKEIFIQDFKHFYGNNYHVADEYVKAFQDVTMYQYSNTSSFYTELHIEHHADGLITDKVPLLRKWNWHLVNGANALFVAPGGAHIEVFAGLENLFKVLRIDAVVTLQNGNRPTITYRVGLGGLIGDVLNDRAFARHDKIINPW